ncbi:hypothetical protein ACQUQP_06955 [Marinobacterium sp. YM272]|uniref:hypothetical protein n=1 Tax=Marinobacterium sp. YM272 TaxID=3421654 RepID=UPI003D800165
MITLSLLMAWHQPLLAETIVRGKLSDQVSERPMMGVQVSVLKGSQVLDTASSETDGRYQLVIDVGTSPSPQTLTLSAELDGYVTQTQDFTVTSGSTDSPAYDLELFPMALNACRITGGHGVIVGYFRAPPAANVSDLTYRISDALTYSLLTRLQQAHLDTSLQPEFWACNEAKLRSATLGQRYATVLGAVAFVTGDVNSADGTYDISTYVSDRFGIFRLPHRSVNQAVDLGDPGAAKLDPGTHGAILTAVAAAYENDGRYAEGVDVTVAAEQLMGFLTPELEAIRSRCQANIENRGLLRGDSP